MTTIEDTCVFYIKAKQIILKGRSRRYQITITDILFDLGQEANLACLTNSGPEVELKVKIKKQ